MAIKTKKITDLNELTMTKDLLKRGGFYLLGCDSGITGKVAAQSIVKIVQETVKQEIAEKGDSTPSVVSNDSTVSSTIEKTVEECATAIAKLSSDVSTIDSKQKSYSFSALEKFDTIQGTLTSLVKRVAALESFVQALQKDGYLTLKEIQKAAADACPICNHTHEEEQSAE